MSETQAFSKYTVGAEIEFYLLSLDGKLIADEASGKFPVKSYAILPEFLLPLQNFRELIETKYSFQTESGAGQFEVNFLPKTNAAELAEDIVAFKDFAKDIAKKCGLQISFAAKPFVGQPGNALHIHYCNEVFDPLGLQANGGVMDIKVAASNDFVLWAIGGLLEQMRESTALFCNDADDMRRFLPWFNAPTKVCWGGNNRSVAVRVPDSKPKRIEHRVACANVEPLPLIEHVIAAAEFGMTNKIIPSAKVFGNAWEDKYDYPLIFV